ncbi:hypothetical protein [Nostoc sp.]|uniref:hypothetical protein n=1 Tax=Nostoc sp. TaxID=1180 RepID=UPI002FF9881C
MKFVRNILNLIDDAKNKSAIIICTEPAFEKKSRLLVRSLKYWGGKFKKIPIISISPRNQEISLALRKEYEQNDVTPIRLPINVQYSSYNLANKPIACEYVETHYNKTSILIFLDSDKVIFNEPTHLLLSNHFDVAVRPVDVKNIGISNLDDDIESEYWKKVYSIASCIEKRKCVTTVDKQNIFEYFNSGMIATKTNKKNFSQWYRNFLSVMDKGIQPSSGLFFVEQSVFAATVSANASNVLILPVNYNYPIGFHNQLDRQARITSFDDIVSIHYHDFLENQKWKSFLGNLQEFDKTSSRYEWLIENLKELED